MIRSALEGDIETSLDIAIEFIKEGYYSHLPIDRGMMYDHAHRALDEWDWLYLVDEIDGEQVGFFSAHIEETLFGPGRVASQDLMFVLPKYRKGMSAVKFLKAFETWAQGNDCMNLYFAPSASVDPRFDALSRRLGFEYIGPQYGKKL
tara:strand:- start:787 stop:1230 length:444 start_codon:yes stop_codon:yes gene_type:complete